KDGLGSECAGMGLGAPGCWPGAKPPVSASASFFRIGGAGGGAAGAVGRRNDSRSGTGRGGAGRGAGLGGDGASSRCADGGGATGAGGWPLPVRAAAGA